MSGYETAPGLGVIDGQDVLYLALLPEGPITVLDGIAAVIWRTATAGREGAAGVAERVALRVDRTADEIADEVEAFLAEMVRRGFLVAR